jgi:photosystem II stability/assembly factor-like uncharacterized protein
MIYTLINQYYILFICNFFIVVQVILIYCIFKEFKFLNIHNMRHKIAVLLFLAAIFTLEIFSGSNTDKHFSKEKDEELGASDALSALQFMNEIRAYPEKDIPADKFYSAYEYSKNNIREYPSRTDDANDWKSMGPNNIGGRSLSLAVHPVDTSTIFIGSASGGLWKSVTGGLGASAWVRVNTGFPNLAVSSIVIDSLNPNLMYIGTGENYGYMYTQNGLNVRVTRGMYGIGILKSTDGGNTWTKALDWTYNSQRGVWKVIINPKNNNIIYAATSEGIYRSNDAGANWIQQLDYKMVMDLEINQQDTSVLYASIGNLTNNIPLPNIGIYKTTNSGSNWTKLTGGLPATWTGKTTIELYKGDPNIINASVSNDLSYIGFYKSTNAGLNWTAGSTTVPIGNQGWYNNALLIKADNSSNVIIGTLNVEKSVNSGTSFTTKSSWSAWYEGATPPGEPEGPSNFVHADIHFFTSNPKDPNKIYILADGGLYRSNNFGETFYSCNGGYVTSQFYNGFANSYQDSIWCLGGLQDNRSAFNQGTTAWYKTFGGDGFWCGVNSQNDNICYTEYTYGDISKSIDRGFTWTDIAPPGGGNSTGYCFSAPYIVCKSNPNVLFAGGTSVYRSTDGGTWSAAFGTSVLNGRKMLSLAASYTSTDTIYGGAVPAGSMPAGLFRSVNGGTNWTEVGIGTIPNRFPTDITVNPLSSNEAVATFGGFGTGHVFRTTDAGITWNNISSNLPDIPHQSVVMDPLYPQNIYVGTDFGVYVSTNSGANWFSYMTGMQESMISDLTIVYPNRSLRATTHGNGNWQRKLVENPVTNINGNNTSTPEKFSLSQNYPNPFNPVTVISYNVPQASYVSLRVYDIQGKEIAVLVNGRVMPGSYDIEFNASALASGIYFYKLRAGNFSETKRMMLVK